MRTRNIRLVSFCLRVRRSSAVSFCCEVVQDLPEYGQARYALGNALLKKGDLTGAIENLERASQLDPEQPDIHYQLGQAYLAAGRKVDGKNQIDISKQLRSRSQTTSNDK